MLFVDTPPLLHVHAPLTGTNQVRKALQARAASVRTVISPTAPVWMIDDREEFQAIRDNPHLLRAGVVRDPWSWYLRLWQEARRRGGRTADALSAWGRGDTSFRAVLYGMTHPESLIEVPRPLGVLWEPDDAGGWPGLLASRLGLCGFTFLYHYGIKTAWRAAGPPVFGVDVLMDLGSVNLALDRVFGMAAKSKVDAPPAPLACAFDEAQIRWVEDADRPLIELMGYAPGRPSAVGDTVPVRRRGSMRTGPGPRPPKEAVWRLGKLEDQRRRRLARSSDGGGG